MHGAMVLNFPHEAPQEGTPREITSIIKVRQVWTIRSAVLCSFVCLSRKLSRSRPSPSVTPLHPHRRPSQSITPSPPIRSTSLTNITRHPITPSIITHHPSPPSPRSDESQGHNKGFHVIIYVHFHKTHVIGWRSLS